MGTKIFPIVLLQMDFWIDFYNIFRPPAVTIWKTKPETMQYILRNAWNWRTLLTIYLGGSSIQHDAEKDVMTDKLKLRCQVDQQVFFISLSYFLEGSKIQVAES